MHNSLADSRKVVNGERPMDKRKHKAVLALHFGIEKEDCVERGGQLGRDAELGRNGRLGQPRQDIVQHFLIGYWPVCRSADS